MSDLLDFSPPGQATYSLSGAKAYFYDAGTTNPRTVYTDQTEAVAHPSPLVADANGIFPQVFASGAMIKVVVTKSDDSTGYTLDPCEKVAAAGAGASQVSFSPTVDLPFTDVQAAIEGAAASAASGFTPFGLGVSGSVSLIADIDATTISSGQYRFDNTTLGTFPTGVAAADTGAIDLARETAGSAWMRLYHDTSERTFFRRMNASTWGAWREEVLVNQGATEGDMIYRTSSNWVRLAKGTASQGLRMNTGATAPSWATLAQTASGVGQLVALSSGVGAALVLPAGGKWFAFWLRVNTGVVSSHGVTVANGGTTISAGVAGENYAGFGWRIE